MLGGLERYPEASAFPGGMQLSSGLIEDFETLLLQECVTAVCSPPCSLWYFVVSNLFSNNKPRHNDTEMTTETKVHCLSMKKPPSLLVN